MNRKDYVELIWNGKEQAIKESELPTNKKLITCEEESKDFDTTQNLYIEGDNLDALKLLKKEYQKKIKMIYIDPPYNTGNKFIYSDNLSHTDWLNMIYPRLKLARDLLTDDGVIFISIDDNEQANLKKVCDEIFGEGNFVASIIDVGTPKNNSKYFSVQQEYAFVYAKQINNLPINWAVKKNNVDEYEKRANIIFNSSLSDEEKHEELLQLIKYPRFYDFDHYTYVDERGIFRLVDISAPGGNGSRYDIIHPITKKPCKQSSRGWAYTKESMNEKIKNNLIYFGADETQIPQQKYYLHENKTQIPRSVIYFDPQKSTKWLKKIGIPFDYVKPLDFIVWLLGAYSSLEEFLVLDFFSGSATTAHAVMKLNAEDGGNRKFIMVQLPEVCAETSEAYKAGYKNICEIGKERIRRAGQKIKDESPLTTQNLDVGFRVLKIVDKD